MFYYKEIRKTQIESYELTKQIYEDNYNIKGNYH